jgi:myo-inositol-1(or 4)-monophosphatase
MKKGTAPEQGQAVALQTVFEGMREKILSTGAFIRQQQTEFERHHAELKSHNDLVSYVDREAEQMLERAGEELIPDCGFILEESGTRRHEDADWLWIIDPLDGTTNFVFGVPIYSISVALQHRGETVMGFVYEINNDECFYALKDGGAYMNDEPIQVSTHAQLAASLIATGFPYRKFGNVEAYLQLLRDFMTSTRGIRRLGSAAVDLAYTAAGRFDGFFESNLRPWDVAAGALIVQEAGGAVTDYRAEDDYLFGRSIAASNGHIHDEMLKLIQHYAQLR